MKHPSYQTKAIPYLTVLVCAHAAHPLRHTQTHTGLFTEQPGLKAVFQVWQSDRKLPSSTALLSSWPQLQRSSGMLEWHGSTQRRLSDGISPFNTTLFPVIIYPLPMLVYLSFGCSEKDFFKSNNSYSNNHNPLYNYSMCRCLMSPVAQLAPSDIFGVKLS